MEYFSKVLEARLAPEYGDVPDGELLTVRPRKMMPKKDVSHYFVSVKDLKTKSNLGWIIATEPFTLNSFIEKYHSGRKPTPDETEHIVIMLRSIQKLPVGTAVAASYSIMGILEKKVHFQVHKVVFRN